MHNIKSSEFNQQNDQTSITSVSKCWLSSTNFFKVEKSDIMLISNYFANFLLFSTKMLETQNSSGGRQVASGQRSGHFLPHMGNRGEIGGKSGENAVFGEVQISVTGYLHSKGHKFKYNQSQNHRL